MAHQRAAQRLFARAWCLGRGGGGGGQHRFARSALTPPMSLALPPPLQAVVVYFDIEFSHCHKPIKFSTGPQAKYTHWKQTVFYLQEPLTAEVGEVLEGVIRCRPNARNHRDLDIELEYRMDGKISKVDVAQAYRLR
jgi:hypothetical protein